MKTLKITLLLAVAALLLPIKFFGQNQLFWIHDDHVKPGMESEYKKLAKEFADSCKKYNISNADWLLVRMDNGTYRYVAPIPNMAALDNNPFATLGEKMGKENFAKLFDGMDKCYDRHNSFIISNIKDLTYMPQGYSVVTPGMDYRKYHYLYVTPSNSDDVAQKIKAIAALYAKKGAKEYFRTYHSGLGCTEEFYVVAISAKDEADYTKTSDEVEKLLGDEGKKAMEDLFKNVDRYEVSTGYAKNDLSYFATKK